MAAGSRTVALSVWLAEMRTNVPKYCKIPQWLPRVHRRWAWRSMMGVPAKRLRAATVGTACRVCSVRVRRQG